MTQKNSDSQSTLVTLKDEDWLHKQKLAGYALVHAMKECVHTIEDKHPNLTLKDLEAIAAHQLELHDCTPTFMGYRGFPGKICVSVNEALVHGIPTDYKLQDGDIVTVDLGSTFEGVIADSAYTCVYGDPKDEHIPEMLDVCKGALKAAIASIKVGESLGIIGHTIHNHVRNSGFGLITTYGGHGINLNELHAAPFVCNREQKNKGIRIQPGLSIAIEPMLVLGKNVNTRILPDKWTIVTKDIGCHFEHSVTLDKNGDVHTTTGWW